MRFSRIDHWLALQSRGATPAAATSLFRKRAATDTDGGEGLSASYPSCDGGYSHSCPMGKVPLGYNSQMGTDGGSVWDLAGRKERENSPSDRLTDVLQRVFFFSTTTQSGIFSSAMQNESELYSFFLQHLKKNQNAANLRPFFFFFFFFFFPAEFSPSSPSVQVKTPL